MVPNPDTIAGLFGWWKADSLALADGDPVATWTDSSSNAFAASQATAAAKPTFKTSILNAKPVLRFDGGDYLDTTCSAAQSTQTLFAVVQPTSTTGDQGIRSCGNDGGLEFRLSSGKPQLVKQFIINVGTATTTVSTTSFSIVTAAFTAGASYAFYLNGAADGGSSTAVTLAAASMVIGRNSSGGGNSYLVGDLAELIVYDSVLSAADRATVHSYLSDKYGITVADYVPPATNQFATAVTAGSWTNVGGAASAIAALSDALPATFLQSPTPPSASTPLLLTMGPLGAGAIVFYIEGATAGGSATRTVTVFKADGTTQIYQTSYTITTTVAEQAVTLDSTALAAIPNLADRTALVVRIADVPA